MKTSIEARRLAKIWHEVKRQGITFSKASFYKVGGATGARLYDVLIATSYYDKLRGESIPACVTASNKKSMKSNVPCKWDEDDYASFIEDWVFAQANNMNIDIIQKRGRKAGISPRRKADVIVAEVQPEPVVEKAELVIELPFGYNELTGEFSNLPEEPKKEEDIIDAETLEIAKAIQVLRKYGKSVTITF